MQEQAQTLTWSETAMYVVGGLSGAALGVLAAIWLGTASTSPSPFLWFVSRAAGVVAYLLLWLSTAWGISVSSKGLGGRVSGVLAYALHNVTAWLALGFGMVHGLSLLGDKVVPFTLLGILVPFVATYQPFLTGLGVISLYLGVIVTGAFYLKKRLGPKAWRTVHGLSYLMFISVTYHGLLIGTDSSTLAMKLIYLLAAVSVGLLTIFRVMTATSAGSTPIRLRQTEGRSIA
jgi:methionine sulfoxide reductase heme-binding subunit